MKLPRNVSGTALEVACGNWATRLSGAAVLMSDYHAGQWRTHEVIPLVGPIRADLVGHPESIGQAPNDGSDLLQALDLDPGILEAGLSDLVAGVRPI